MVALVPWAQGEKRKEDGVSLSTRNDFTRGYSESIQFLNLCSSHHASPPLRSPVLWITESVPAPFSSHTILVFAGKFARSCQRNSRGCPQGRTSVISSFSIEDRCERTKPLFLPTTPMKECAMSQTLLAMAKDLVLVQIQAHKLLPDDMHHALQQTYTTLMTLKAQEDAEGSVPMTTPEIPSQPVHWRKSITKHTVTCLECGASFKQLSVRHLKAHALDGKSYRIKYGIPRTQPLSAKETTSRR